MKFLGDFDVAVIGAGHAGIEAAIASAKRGCRTALFTISLDQIGNMPCNPSIGGSAKGHLVREIDALGGVMAEAADACCIQMRMLNLSKGASVHSPRAQEDRKAYQLYMKNLCENTHNLQIIQAEIADILIDDQQTVSGVVNVFGGIYCCKAVVICAGTFLRGRIFVGQHTQESGPDACLPARFLSQCLEKHGVSLRRFKTGTPCRVHRRSIDYSRLIPQSGDLNPRPFSFMPKSTLYNDAMCYIANTNPTTHQIIRDNLSESPLYGGMIEGVGPRYCPSIEDKVMRFAQRERHQIFVEPTGLNSEEMYLQGFSTSLPEYVQIEMLRSVAGFEHIEIMRSAYAIEYDCINPLCLYATLAFRDFYGLYSAGQFNGTSGYEEAAAQGLVAGINASAYVLHEEQLVLPRQSSYIGTLIDDLVSKGCEDPYRMMTARSEYRLSLRHSTADARLTPIGHQYGLISEERFAAFSRKMERIARVTEHVSQVTVSPSQSLNAYLERVGTSPLQSGMRFDALLRRPQVDFSTVIEALPIELLHSMRLDRDALTLEETEEVNLQVKYQQYIERQNHQNAQLAHLERIRLPQTIDYQTLIGLSSEAKEKLTKQKPENLRQAALISGVSPADINIILSFLKAGGHRGLE
ncbi:MAG: tRNA uridine-5-carboxymethylaminomethyl(34) synthesis enzyme MnmG [Oscillospiraceae bacterium]|nr:tRNA uridine-5-carboxymethylaminomethyl(34) synthesis enzyme MnmG [Oscillospiraceae bacterium]